MNDRFQKYRDVLSPQRDKIRLKRKVNETNKNINRLVSHPWPEIRRNKTIYTTINRGPEKNQILSKNIFGKLILIYVCWCFLNKVYLENKTNNSKQNESHQSSERVAQGAVESFSFYMSKDRRVASHCKCHFPCLYSGGWTRDRRSRWVSTVRRATVRAGPSTQPPGGSTPTLGACLWSRGPSMSRPRS